MGKVGGSIATSILAFGLAGCGNIQPAIKDTLTTAQLAQQKKAVAILKLGSADHSCLEIEARFGVPNGVSYKIVKAAKTGASKAAFAAHIVEAEFDPGEIHLVEMTCKRVKSLLKLGEPGPGGTAMKSLASVRIAPGEILNIGDIQISESKNAKRAHLTVGELPLAALEAYKQAKPNLFAQMKSRLMTVSAEGPANEAQHREMCTRLQQYQAAGKIEKLPPECTDSPAPEIPAKAPTAARKPGGT